MGTQGAGRKRSTKKDKSTAEDDALNLIAREAEARLAAKRAARAEAREIRMKELERQQKEIFQVQKKYYGLNTKTDDRGDNRWEDIEQWMEDSERYSRSSQIHMLSDDDERMSMGSQGNVRLDLDAVGAYGGGGFSHKKSKKKSRHKPKDKDRNGYDDDYSIISSRSSRLSDESRASRSSRLDLVTSYASSDLYSLNGLSSSRNTGSAFNGYQGSLYEDSLSNGSRRVTGSVSHPLEYTSYRSSSSRASSRASSARASPVDNCSSVASYLRSVASGGGLPQDLDDVTIPGFSNVEDRDYLEKGSRAASVLTATTLTSLGGTSSRRGSGETAITVDAETSIQEIKEIHELKDQIQAVETKYTQNLKEVKDTLAEVEEKYRKAMVSNAQLDNEKNNLMYQVDTLKDSLMELEELLSESRREYEEKAKDHEREKHAHSLLQFQFNEMKETLKQSEELLNEIRQLRMKQDSFVREISDLQETVEWKDKKIGALERQKEYTEAIRTERDELREEVVKLKDILKKHGIVLGPDLNINGGTGEAEVDGLLGGDSTSQPAQDSPAEGNSMLGNTEETLLRSCREEEKDPEQYQEILKEEAKENQLGSDMLCVVDVSKLETSCEEHPTEEQTCLATVGKSTGENDRDLNVDINDNPLTEANELVTCRPEQDILTSVEENTLETRPPEGGSTGGISNPDLGEKEIISSSFDTENDHFNKQEYAVEQIVVQDVMKEIISSVSDTDPQLEPVVAEEAENEEAVETASKSQGITTVGKKKKKKKKGKKKGTQQKDGTEKENVKKEQGLNSAKGDNESATDPNIDSSLTEILKESGMDQPKTEQDGQQAEEASEPCSHTGVLGEEETLETLTVEEINVVPQSEILSHIKAAEVLRPETTNQTGKPEEVESVSPPVHLCTGLDPTDASNSTVGTAGLAIECIYNADNPVLSSSCPGIHSETEVLPVEVPPEIMAGDSEYSPLPSISDAAADETESMTNPAKKDSTSVLPLYTDDCPKSLSDSESPDPSTLDATPIKPPHSDPEEATETTKDDKEPDIDSEQTSLLLIDTSLSRDSVNVEFNQDAAQEKELNRDFREPEAVVEPASFSHYMESDSCDTLPLMQTPTALDTENEAVETVPSDEHLDDVEGETSECMKKLDESKDKVFLDTSGIKTTDSLNSPDLLREFTDMGSSLEQDHRTAGDPAVDEEHKVSPSEQESERSLCPLAVQLHEPSKDKPEDESCQPPQASDEDDVEDKEAQSFDFDDLDIETAVQTSALEGQGEERVEDGVEVLSDEINNDSLELCQTNKEINDPQNKPTGSNNNKSLEDEGNQVHTLNKELDTMPPDSQNSLAHEDATSDEAWHIRGEGAVLSVREEDAVENINQPISAPLEEGLDVMNHELQGDYRVPNTSDQVVTNKEQEQSGKGAKKKKGKGKEDCKMS